ncbi:shikimate dehydrogenase [Methylobacterium indicum]|uniref:shikimate dehydrogenase n=1 Tax=Methylobacterium indicum TaxID=1775910 RepID=UPI000733F6AE|nr:shikimate dehydrogenase [Methylobacterium indicum]KTS16234.1 shikimate dehydrogenase [Methylobacterium indicum]KTS39450.1 shikimate dehydrogenase [Methylobacterium indicum]KTS47212.1 shikimate dehydrogenase [Methylobacterium indicum]
MGASPRSVLAGLIGNGIQASRTPPMHEHEGDAQGLRLLYQTIDLEKLGLGADALPDLLTAAERMGFSGLNITHPCKQAVLAHLDALSPDAAALGAVNTVVLRDGKRVGHNTDWWGFAEAFRRGLPDVNLDRVVQLGAGGAGAAVAHALLTLGVKDLVLNDIDPARAAGVAASLCERFGAGRARACTDLAAEVAAADGLVHCTPTGMDKYPGLPLPAEYLHPRLFVAEIVYFPLETALLREARRIGCRTLDGGGMAVFQAVEAFRLITGLTPDPERMLRHFAELGRTA